MAKKARGKKEAALKQRVPGPSPQQARRKRRVSRSGGETDPADEDSEVSS